MTQYNLIPAPMIIVINTRKPAPRTPYLIISMYHIILKMNPCLHFLYPIVNTNRFHILHPIPTYMRNRNSRKPHHIKLSTQRVYQTNPWSQYIWGISPKNFPHFLASQNSVFRYHLIATFSTYIKSKTHHKIIRNYVWRTKNVIDIKYICMSSTYMRRKCMLYTTIILKSMLDFSLLSMSTIFILI